MLIGSTKTFTPCDSNTWSPAPCPFSSIIRPYWKPEQPPPCTNTRRPLLALFSSASSSLIFMAAVSETLIMETLYQEPIGILHSRLMPYVPIPTVSRAKLTESAVKRWQAIGEAPPHPSPARALHR